MKEYYWRTEDGRSGLTTAANEHAAYQVILSMFENSGWEYESDEWAFERVDNLLEV